MVLVTFVLPLSLIEVILRTTNIGSPHAFVVHNDLVLKGRPHARFVNRSENVREVRYNNWGFHDRDRGTSMEAHRVLMLGDSFVEGRQVPVGLTFTALIERTYRDRGVPTEVINAGFSGTGTAHQYALWRTFFKSRIEIDHLIIFVFLGNDLEDNGLSLGNRQLVYVPYVTTDGGIDVVKDESLRRHAFVWARRQSALLNTAAQGYAVFRRWWSDRGDGGGSPMVAADNGVNSAEAWTETVSATLRLIERWSAETGAGSVKFSVVMINPATFYRTGTYRNHHYVDFKKGLQDLSRRIDMPLLELDFSRYPPEQLYSHDGITLGHFNELGHRLAADQIFDWLSSHN
ncbi:MAG: hypothetical protein GEU82_02910 [Luteitalea sp.]|nr:hypothetical protein [Luteitalea sp.]